MRGANRTWKQGSSAFTSEKFENHVHMVALYAAWFSFVKQHKSLKGLSPTIAAAIADTLWSMEDIAELVESAAPKPGPRGPYKKRITTA